MKKNAWFYLLLMVTLLAGTFPATTQAEILNTDFKAERYYVDIMEGDRQYFALDQDGVVWAWRYVTKSYSSFDSLYDHKKRPIESPVRVMDNVEKMCDSDYYSLFIKKDGSLWAWGFGGGGGVLNRLAHVGGPTRIMENVADAAVGSEHILVAKRDGTVWATGYNNCSSFGFYSTDSDIVHDFVQVPGISDVVSVAAASSNSFAIKRDGSLWAWGYMPASYEIKSDEWLSWYEGATPYKVMDHVLKVAVESTNAAIIDQNYDLWGWGGVDVLKEKERNSGNYNTHDRKPVKIMGGVKDVGFLSPGAYVVKTDGSLWVNGYFYDAPGSAMGYDCIGGDMKYHKLLDNVSKCSGNMALVNGEVWAWGKFAVSGEVMAEGLITTTVLDNVESIHSAWLDTTVMALDRNGSLYTWGAQGESLTLGNGTRFSRNRPVKIMDNVAKAYHSARASLAVKKDGTLWMWGDYSTRNDYSLSASHTPVKIMDDVIDASCDNGLSSLTVLAVKRDGTLWGWGHNEYGQLGLGYISESGKTMLETPQKIMDNVVKVEIEHYGVAALRTDGSLWTWGNNNHGQMGLGLKDEIISTPAKVMDHVSQFYVGDFNMFVIKDDGSLWTWGLFDEFESASRKTHEVESCTPRRLPVENAKMVAPSRIWAPKNFGVALASWPTVVVTKDNHMLTEMYIGYSANARPDEWDYCEFKREIPDVVYGNYFESNSPHHSGDLYYIKSDGVLWSETYSYYGYEMPRPRPILGGKVSEPLRDEVDAYAALRLIPTTLQSGYQYPIAREEFSRLAVRYMEQLNEQTDLNYFLASKDLDPVDYGLFRDTVHPDSYMAYALGLFQKTGHLQFSPEKPITRLEAARALARIAALLDEDLAAPAVALGDMAGQSAESKEAVNFVLYHRIMTCPMEGVFNPDGPITREEAIASLYRLYQSF